MIKFQCAVATAIVVNDTYFLYGLKKRVYQKGGVGVIKHPSEERHQNIIGGC